MCRKIPCSCFAALDFFWGWGGGVGFVFSPPVLLMDRGEDGRYLCRMHVKSGTKRGLFSWQPH